MRGPDDRKVRIGRRLRRQSTDAESTLWFALRDRRLSGFKFVRQEAVGWYIVDFVCRDKMLIVEIDGGQHAENVRDLKRDAELGAEGYRVLRFWDHEVLKNRTGILETILEALNTTSLRPVKIAPHPAFASQRPPSPRKRGERESKNARLTLVSIRPTVPAHFTDL